jgi:hypothetical protein
VAKPSVNQLVDRRQQLAGGGALAPALPEARQSGGGAQLERLGLLPSRDLQRLVAKRLRLLDRSGVHVGENLCPQPVELGIVVVLSLLLGLRDAESERAQGDVVARDLRSTRPLPTSTRRAPAIGTRATGSRALE